MIEFEMRTGRGMNSREHWRHRHARVRQEKTTVGYELLRHQRPHLPVLCTLTRLAPSNGLDTDNLQGAMKSVRDAVAWWLGVDDSPDSTVQFVYEQERSTQWAVRIEFRKSNK